MSEGVTRGSPFPDDHALDPREIALGADHGGFEMKEAIKQYLQARGMTVMDFGAKTKDPADDYPDFAQPAARAVAATVAPLRA